MPITPPKEAKRALFALAILGLKANEVAQFRRYMRDVSHDEFAKILKKIEGELYKDLLADLDEAATDAKSEDDTIIIQALSVLRDGTGLKNPDIVEAVSNELRLSNVAFENIGKYDNRKSIVSWLRSVNRVIGPSRLLQLSTKIRERILKTERPHWSLEREK
jgi:hypothetical protein